MKQGLLSGVAVASLIVTGVLQVEPANAISVRADQAPLPGGIQDYWDQTNSRANVGNIQLDYYNTGNFQNSCTGTLINSRTILTAAHCFTDRAPGGQLIYNTNSVNGYRITFAPDSQDGQTYSVTGAIANANYDGDSTDDIALLTLDAPVLSITPVVLTSVAPQVGDVIEVVGYGLSGAGGRDVVVDNGNGLEFTNSDDKRRIVYNYVDAVGPIPGQGDIIVFDYDDPASPQIFNPGGGIAPSNTPVHALEGASAGGDSGGPTFMQLTDGAWVQVGVSQGGDDPLDAGDGNYTGLSTYTNVASYLDWIAQNNPLRTVSAGGAGNWSDAALWSESQVPDNVVSTTPGETRYFNVTLTQPGTVIVDTSSSVDRVTLEGGALTVANGQFLNLEDRMIVGAGSVARVDGWVSGQTEVTSGGVLGGVGTILGAVANAGVLSPGNSIGHLTIDGSLRLQTGGQLLVEADLSGADQLTVIGTVTLGGFVQVVPDIRIASGTSISFLSASNVAGAFDGVTSPSLFFTPTLSQSGTDVTVTLTKRDGGVGSVAASATQGNIARILEALPVGVSSSLRSAIVAIGGATSVGEVQSLLRQLSGENHGLDPSIGARAIAGINAMVVTRVARLGAGPGGATASLTELSQAQSSRFLSTKSAGDFDLASSLSQTFNMLDPISMVDGQAENLDAMPDGSVSVGARQTGMAPGLWLEHSSTRGDVDASIGSSAVGYEISGTTIGFDTQITDNMLLGGAASYTKTTTDIVTGLGDNAKTRGTHGTIYGRYGFDGFSLSGVLNFSKNETEALRVTKIGGVTQRALADYDGWATAATIGITTTYDLRGIDVSPALSLTYSRQWTEGFDETGSAALLSVSSRRNDALNVGNVVRLSRGFELTDNARLTPEIRFGGIYDLLDEDAAITARFSGTQTGFRAQGSETNRGGVVLGGGAVLSLPDAVHFYVDYESYLAGNEQFHTALIGARLNF